MTEILRLRREKAELLGYRDFADLVLDDRMAHTGAHAQQFLVDIHAKVSPFFERENESLASLGQALGYATVEPWDMGYLAEKQRQALYDFDEEELRPYFQLDQVVNGMFEIFGRLLGIKVIEEHGIPAWDAAVKYYRVEDAASGHFAGWVLCGLVSARKQTGRRVDGFAGHRAIRMRGHPHVGLICGNLTPPVGDTPSLLTHREVETIFHEFGHLLHHTLEPGSDSLTWPAQMFHGILLSYPPRSWRTGAWNAKRLTCLRGTGRRAREFQTNCSTR